MVEPAANPFIVPTTEGLRLACHATIFAVTPSLTEVRIHAVPIDERVESVSVDHGGMVFSAGAPDDGNPAVRHEDAVELHLCWENTGLWLVGDEESEEVTDDPRFAGLVDAMDCHWLDAWAVRCAEWAGEPVAHGALLPENDLAEVEPDHFVPWAVVFEDARVDDSYRHRGETWIAIDMYCVEPDCECGQMLVSFAVDDADADASEVLVDLDGEVTLAPTEGHGETLAALWTRYQRRHHGLSTLLERRPRMRQFGRRLFGADPAGESAVKVGRNEPCPCGSGRKFKRCCGRR